MKYINKIKSIISNIYNNIMYIVLNDIKQVHINKINELNETIDKRTSFIDRQLSSLKCDVDGLLDYEILERHDIESIIVDEIGYKENLATYDEVNNINDEILDLKSDIKSLDISLNKNNIERIDTTLEVDLLVDEVIKSIINKLEVNENV